MPSASSMVIVKLVLTLTSLFSLREQLLKTDQWVRPHTGFKQSVYPTNFHMVLWIPSDEPATVFLNVFLHKVW